MKINARTQMQNSYIALTSHLKLASSISAPFPPGALVKTEKAYRSMVGFVASAASAEILRGEAGHEADLALVAGGENRASVARHRRRLRRHPRRRPLRLRRFRQVLHHL